MSATRGPGVYRTSAGTYVLFITDDDGIIVRDDANFYNIGYRGKFKPCTDPVYERVKNISVCFDFSANGLVIVTGESRLKVEEIPTESLVMERKITV